MDYDSAALERVAQRFRYEMWKSAVPDVVADLGIDVQRFGPVQATAFADEPEVPSLNQIQGAAEPGAIEGGHLADAVEWMRSREVDRDAGQPDLPEALMTKAYGIAGRT